MKNPILICLFIFIALQQVIAQGPGLGMYPVSSNITSGGNMVIMPDEFPTDITGISAYTSAGFKGILQADYSAGEVIITNAYPAGTYEIFVKAYNSTDTITRSFNLVVIANNCSQGLFTGNTAHGVGSLPFSAAIGDFNRDGIQDIVTANYGNNNVSIRMGNGTGGFTGNLSYNTGTGPQSVAVADFNTDGVQDLAIANFSGSSVSILTGNGYGGFNTTATVTVGAYPYSIAVSDFNNDAIMDFVTADYGSNKVSIRLGNGAGGFSGLTELTTGNGPRFVTIADVNLDGKSDIITANFDNNTISIFTGNGTGGFSLVNNIPVGNKPYSVSAADFNADGIPDLATANNLSNNVSILLGNVSGGFINNGFVPVGINPRSVITGDFNGDGYTDLATSNINSNNISVRLGIGNGSFLNTADFNTGASPFSLVTGDFNRDGILDLASANAGNNSISVLLGSLNDIEISGNNNLIEDADYLPSVTDNTDFGDVGSNQVRSFNIHNTGAVKLSINSIVTTGTDSSLFVIGGIDLPLTIEAGSSKNFTISFTPTSAGIKNAVVNITSDDCDEKLYDFAIQGNGISLSPPVLGSYPATIISFAGGNSVVMPSGIPANTTAITAFASPGFKGSLFADPVTGNVSIINAHPAGIYTVTVKVNGILTATTVFTLTVLNGNCSQGLFGDAVITPLSNSAHTLALNDFNGDGLQDLAVAGNNSNSIAIYSGNGTGGFSQLSVVLAGSESFALTTSDFNGDGYADLASANKNSNRVTVYFGNGSGAFGTSISLPVGAGPRSIVSGDFNNDGKADFATADHDSHTVSIRFGDGFGGFNNFIVLSAGMNPRSIISVDFNNDGHADLATANSGSDNVSVFSGNGLGSFNVMPVITVGTAPFSLASADLNNDGKQDFLIANHNSNTVSVRLGDGFGLFTGSIDLPVGNNPGAVVTGDFNGDGYTDFATANYSGHSISLRLGKGDGTFIVLANENLANNPRSILTGDFNNDGRQDLAALNTGPGNISVLPGSINEIEIQGNGAVIASGDNSPSQTDYTDFGNVSNNLIRAFTIRNNGSVNLKVSSMFITGNDSALFTIGGISLPAIVSAGSSITFTISFTPGNTGLKNATVWLSNDDCDEGNYNFEIAGTGFSEFDPTLGVYPPAVVPHAGGNITVIPSAPPTNANFITAYTSANFKGLFEVDPLTGIVSITNAHPAGVYNVTVKVSGIAVAASNFILTVNNTGCSNALFSSAADVAVGNLPFSVAVGDFNGDGNQDLVTANYASNNASVRFGDGYGGFNGSNNIPAGNNPNAVAVGDFNGDGRQDFAVSNYFSNSVSIRLGDGFGGFINSTEVNVGTLPTYVTIGDFNNDGKQDIAAVISGNTTLAIRLGDGSGNFTGSNSAVLGSGAFSVAIADFNGDGKQDIASADYNIDTVSINLGDGLGGFYLASQIEVGINPYAITVGEFNGDGIPDIATANFNNDNVSIRLGDGNGFFSGTTEIPAGAGPGAVSTGDFNGDGKQDIAVANYTGNTVSIRLGNGNGNFTGTTELPMDSNPYLTVIGDFNNDGKQDLAIGKSNNSIAVSLGTGKEINVIGNNTDITDADISPDVSDHTDFGIGNNSVRNYTIQNKGTLDLSVSNIFITGTDADLFSISNLSLPVSVAPGASLTFSIAFSPVYAGLKTAIVNIINDDCDEGLYDFAIQGTFECPVVVTGISGLSNAFCLNAPETTISGFPATGGVFSGAGITGSVNGMAVFSPLLAGPGGPYAVLYTYTDVANGCVYDTTQMVMVNQLPEISISGLEPIYCINAVPSVLTVSPAGTVLSGPGINGNLFDPLVAGTGGPHIITYAYTDINGCSNSGTMAVVVNPLPAVDFTGLPVSVCINASDIVLTGFPAGGIFAGPGISGDVFSPANAGSGGSIPVTYTYTDNYGCSNSITKYILVHALPVVGITGLNAIYCPNAPAANISGFPTGGLFSGPGITGNVFDPSLVSPGGTYPVTYTYSDIYGCSNSITTIVTITALQAVSITGLSSLYCTTDAMVTVTASEQGGVFSFSGNGFTDNGNGTALFDPVLAGAGGPYTLTYTYTNGNGCTVVAVQTVTVIDCPLFATLNLKLFLEGYYRGGSTMVSTLYELGISPDPSATDSIMVNLWSPGNLSVQTADYSAIGILHSNGTIQLQFPPGVIGHLFYIAVKHRNSLETWSSNPVFFSDFNNYDFTTGLFQVYGDGINPPMALVGADMYAIYSGDVNQDGTVDASDMAKIDNDNSIFAFGYNSTDINGDGASDASDIAIVDNNQQLFLFYARPY